MGVSGLVQVVWHRRLVSLCLSVFVVKNGEPQRHQDTKRHKEFCRKRCAKPMGRLRQFIGFN